LEAIRGEILCGVRNNAVDGSEGDC
jgi:hypothetical protein